jgi:hypothetical protein
VRRDWTAAREKVAREGRCRYCGRADGLQAAHVIGRKHDATGMVNPNDIVPLCLEHHHQYDHGKHGLELLPHLTYAEQAAAVSHVGIMAALKRTTRH